MRNYFIRYNPKDKVNYTYLFMFYGIAEYNKKSWTYNKITFNSKKDLAKRLTATYKKKAFSYSTLVRIMSNKAYNDYFTVADRQIILNNNFGKNSNNEGKPFVILTDKEADFLIQSKDNLLAQYYLYLKYYCGLAATAGRKQDFTAKQFLLSVGLSANNNNNLSKVSHYNTLLVNAGFIKIDKYRDKQGNERNNYSIIPMM